MHLVDLSHPIIAGMPVYPGDPNVKIEPALKLHQHGANVASLQLGTHTGTHLDAPSHLVAGGRTVDQLNLKLLQGTSSILQVKHTGLETLQDQQIGIHQLEPLPETLPKIVCVATGWDTYFDGPLREQHPFLDIELAQTLWQKGARVLGLDTLSPDPTRDDSSGAALVHEFWLGNDGIIVENLTGLTQLPAEVYIQLLPLPLVGLDGSPVRAVAQFPERRAQQGEGRCNEKSSGENLQSFCH